MHFKYRVNELAHVRLPSATLGHLRGEITTTTDDEQSTRRVETWD